MQIFFFSPPFLSTFFVIRKRKWRRFPRLFHPLLTSLKTIQFKFNKLEGKRVCFREKAFQERLAIFRRVQLRGQRRTLYNSDIITRVTGDTNIERYGRAACYERRGLRHQRLPFPNRQHCLRRAASEEKETRNNS